MWGSKRYKNYASLKGGERMENSADKKPEVFSQLDAFRYILNNMDTVEQKCFASFIHGIEFQRMQSSFDNKLQEA